jgi:hypothetical protein
MGAKLPKSQKDVEKLFDQRGLGVIFYSKVQDSRGYSITAENLERFFRHILQPELIKNFYFVDDSEEPYQTQLIDFLHAMINRHCSTAKTMIVTDNGSIYDAVNNVWNLIKDQYVISLNSDFATIKDIPLGAMLKSMDMYPDVYLINLKTRRLFGYNDSKGLLRSQFPMWQHLSDDAQETWYCRDERGRILSVPKTLLPLQKGGRLSLYYWGIELVPRPVDEENTLWTPRFPSKLLLVQPTCTHFIGGSVVYRTEVIKKYLPLPKRYKDKEPAQCKEVYFWRHTDIDAKYYVGWLNLQVFIVHYGDPRSSQNDVQKKYWESFIKNNSVPIVCKNAPPWRQPTLAMVVRRFLIPYWHDYVLNPWLRLVSFIGKMRG